ncbi:MAG TPA: thiamine phosphate synthase [Actinomycetota bacterium]|nr:thiamine phosphate synthase [Actinomycetota bacterium]
MTDLSSARLYLVSTARIAAGLLVDFVPQLASAGVDLIQLREKEMEAGDVIAAAVPIADACRAAGVPFIVNDRADIAVAVGADGVHVGQNDLPVGAARSIVGDRIVGLSTHRPEEVDAATTSGADYFAVGPVYETPTKLGRPGVGLELIEHAASIGGTAPWFAIGGIDPGNLPDVVAAGATRIVVVRAITEASDPVAATAELRRILDR